MKEQLNQLTDQQFLIAFENKSLDPAYFDHNGHLRLAWLYLTQNSFEQALSLTFTGIKAYAESLGATDKFHLTITDSIVRIMALRIESTNAYTWSEFSEINPDLFDDMLSVLAQFFSHGRLFSVDARNTLVTPDLKCID